MALSATLFSDPRCPRAYSAGPALTALTWRYGEGLEWRLVLIGLTEHGEQYEKRGYTPARSAGERTLEGGGFQPRGAAEDAFTDLAAGGAIRRQPLADDALWVAA